MRKSPPDKVLVTNLSALRANDGAAYNKHIKPAVNALIAADKGRGLTTVLVALDDAKAMTGYKGNAVITAADPKQNKQAIDAVFKALRPVYLCILGSIDVVPHQNLKNPLSDGDPAVQPDGRPGRPAGRGVGRGPGRGRGGHGQGDGRDGPAAGAATPPGGDGPGVGRGDGRRRHGLEDGRPTRR